MSTATAPMPALSTETAISKPGFYYDIPVAAYHADPCPKPSFTQSIAKVILDQSPLHAKYAHPRLRPTASITDTDDADVEREKYKKAEAIGNAAHALILGRGKGLAIGHWTSWRKKEAQEFYDAAIAEGRTPILLKHHNIALDMAGSVDAQIIRHEANDCFTNGRGEVVMVWQEDGFWFRCMVDWLHDDFCTVDDLKTTGGSVAPHIIPLKMDDDGWDVQAAMFERGLNALNPENAGRRAFRFVAMESQPPCAISVHTIGEGVLTFGRRKLNAAFDKWKECLTTGNWHGYSDEVFRPLPPEYRESKWEERLLELESV